MDGLEPHARRCSSPNSSGCICMLCQQPFQLYSILQRSRKSVELDILSCYPPRINRFYDLDQQFVRPSWRRWSCRRQLLHSWCISGIYRQWHLERDNIEGNGLGFASQHPYHRQGNWSRSRWPVSDSNLCCLYKLTRYIARRVLTVCPSGPTISTTSSSTPSGMAPKTLPSLAAASNGVMSTMLQQNSGKS